MDNDTNKTEYSEFDSTDAYEEYEKEKTVKVYNRSKAVKIIAIEIFTFVVLIVAVIAWFAMGKDLKTGGMSMTTTDMDYELAVKGSNIGAISYSGTGTNSGSYVGTPINNLPSGANVEDGSSGTYKASGSDVSEVFYTTGEEKQSILWRLESEYNRYAEGLGPSSFGSFTFYVVPKRDGDIAVTASLSIEGYSAKVEKNEDASFHAEDLKSIDKSSTEYKAVTYLKSHLLFFTERIGSGTDSDPYYYRGLIGDNLNLSFSNCKENELIPVTIYWIWPNTFAQMVCIASDGNIAKVDGTTADRTTITDVRKFVIDHSTDILKDITNSKAMEYMGSGTSAGGSVTYEFSDTLAMENLTVLSTGYNKADQQIGTTVNYILVVLTAEQ